jgi:hypothetical protein
MCQLNLISLASPSGVKAAILSMRIMNSGMNFRRAAAIPVATSSSPVAVVFLCLPVPLEPELRGFSGAITVAELEVASHPTPIDWV